ncbi:Matrixin [Rhodococcus sp. Eu-32]|uniref:zinc-dependent metalloprotease n=1 Tax=Rhodococcus sp. Eu-32 TaxID=1017319 RepID=UPI000DF3C1B3|nr:zinc-dependent metalloprotease [Rhodococcus sp. Eu-32]RRQ26584.1 Matrixin [Rhodococcus sp. Eu-32]
MSVASTTAHDGYFPLVADHDRGRVHLGIRNLGTAFLLSGGLETGVGASEIPLDRGYPGPVRLARFVRYGQRVVLEYLTASFANGRQEAGPSQRPVDDSFARSVVFSGEVVDVATLAELVADSVPEAHAYVDITDFLVSDLHDFAAAIYPGVQPVGAPPGSVKYRRVADRSFPLTRQARSFAGNTELVAAVTFEATDTPPAALVRVVPDPRSLTFTQRLSFVPLPGGFEPRPYHPGSGGWRNRYEDPALVGSSSIDVSFQPRFRTQDRPIVFSVDPGIPEPYLQAVLDGASWWQQGFAAIGRPDDYRVEVLPAERDPWEIGTNPVWWVHRSGRGWSIGHSVADPFTGEIVRGSVRLGSQRVTQLRILFEALLSPYGREDEAERLADIEQAIVRRIRQLAAHEVGHALGFQHNFASNGHPVASVMDYPHASIDIRPDGELSLRNAYPDELGPWDRFLVAHAYGPGDDLDGVRASVSHLPYLNDPDGHSPRATSWRAVPWTIRYSDDIPDAFAALDHILAVRAKALADFGVGVAPAESPLGEVEARLGSLYFLHRFQVQAVARYLGGVDYSYGQGRDGVDAVTTASPKMQRKALRQLSKLLSDDVLRIDTALIDRLTPPSIGYERAASNLGSRFGAAFDPVAYAEAAASLVASEVLSSERLNRIHQQHATDSAVPSIDSVVDALLKHADAVSVRFTIARHALHTLASGKLTAAARVEVRRAIERRIARSDQATGDLVRRGLAGVDADTLRDADEFALPVVPAGIPL